jgi:hypothetical protein
MSGASSGAPVNDHEVRQLELLDIDDLLWPSEDLGMSTSLSEAKLKCSFQDTTLRSLGVSLGKSRASSASPRSEVAR